MSDRHDIAWAAGLFEGEGSIGVRKDGDYKRTLIQLKSTDHDVLVNFKAAVGVGRLTGPYHYSNPNHKPYWQWSVTIRRDFKWVCLLLGPYLHARRIEQMRMTMIEVGDSSLDEDIAEWKANL